LMVSLRENPAELETFLEVFTSHWGNAPVYRNCLSACLKSTAPLPQWYIMRT